MAAFNKFNFLKPMMKEAYSDEKKKGFKAPPSMPKAAKKEACKKCNNKDCKCKGKK